ncbi:hypothetical protein BASA60_001809, partial [Batrachochytrium salamandrivorans]
QEKAIQIGILVDTHPFSVDHCILCDQQLLSTSIAHIVVECEQVAGYRIQSGLVPAIQKSRLRLLGRALDPGVENVYTWLRGGVLNGEADLDQQWLDGTVEHESMGTRHDNRALAARLADFLQFIQKKDYGLELVWWQQVTPCTTADNDQQGYLTVHWARLSTAIGPLLVETGIGSLLTRSLVSRVRLLERSVTKRTPINAICSGTDNDVFTLNVQGQLVRSQRWFWSRRTKQLYRNRYWLTPQVRPKTVKQRHSFALMETLRTCGDSASLQNTSIAHLVVECEQVAGHRIQSGLVPAIQKSRLRLLGRSTRSGCGECIYLAPRWSLNGEADLDQRWLDGTVEHESMGTRHDNRALAARLADFLQVAYRQYQSTLWKYHRDRLVEVG